MGQLTETALAFGALAVIGFVFFASMLLVGAAIYLVQQVWRWVT